MHHRRDITCLSTDQLHDLREALTAMQARAEDDPTSWAVLAGLHGQPSPSWCIHGHPGFLTWHRAYLMAFEHALGCGHPGVTLPYWDWSSGDTVGLPAACASPTYVDRNGNTVPNPLYSGPISTAAGGGSTARRSDIDTTSFADLGESARDALDEASFTTFRSLLNGVHGSVHGRVGGNMGSVPRAAFDPIFWLHHANVDRLWAVWQDKFGTALPNDEATQTLAPFTRPFSSDWQTGDEVEHISDLGYDYLGCVIFIPWLPPFRVIEFQFPWELFAKRPWARARLTLRQAHMTHETVEVELRVGGAKGTKRALTVFGGPMMKKGEQRHAVNHDVQFDVSRTLRRAAETDTTGPLSLKLGSRKGAAEAVSFEGVELALG